MWSHQHAKWLEAGTCPYVNLACRDIALEADVFACKEFCCAWAQEVVHARTPCRAWICQGKHKPRQYPRAPAWARKPTLVFLRRTTVPASGSSRPARAHSPLLAWATGEVPCSYSTLHRHAAQPTPACAGRQGLMAHNGMWMKAGTQRMQSPMPSAHSRSGSRTPLDEVI